MSGLKILINIDNIHLINTNAYLYQCSINFNSNFKKDIKLNLV